MSKRDKLVQKIFKGSQVSFQEVHDLLVYLGFSVRVAGSHHIFVKPGQEGITIPLHHPVKAVYLKQLSEVLRRHGYE